MLILDSLLFYILSITLIASSIFACFANNLYYATIFLYIFLFGLSFLSFAMKTPLNGMVSMLFGCLCAVLLIMFFLFTIKPNIEKNYDLKLKKNIIFFITTFSLFITALAFILTKLQGFNLLDSKIQSIGVETITIVSNSLCIRYFIIYLIIPILFLSVLTGVFMIFYKKRKKNENNKT